MSKETIYISIHISDHDDAAQRTKAEQIATMLSETGYSKVINPFRVGDMLKASIKREPTYEEYMKADLGVLMLCDAIYMCSGWETSAGCRRERQQAINQGQEVIYEYEQGT